MHNELPPTRDGDHGVPCALGCLAGCDIGPAHVEPDFAEAAGLRCQPVGTLTYAFAAAGLVEFDGQAGVRANVIVVGLVDPHAPSTPIAVIYVPELAAGIGSAAGRALPGLQPDCYWLGRNSWPRQAPNRDGSQDGIDRALPVFRWEEPRAECYGHVVDPAVQRLQRVAEFIDAALHLLLWWVVYQCVGLPVGVAVVSVVEVVAVHVKEEHGLFGQVIQPVIQ